MILKLFSIFIFITTFVTFDSKIYIKNYYPNGKLKEEGWMLNNQKTDYWFYYFENGLKKEEGHYKNNQKTNWWIFYDEKQTIIKKSEFINDRMNGLSIIYSKGEIAKAEKYSNGKKIKTWTNLSEFKKDNNF